MFMTEFRMELEHELSMNSSSVRHVREEGKRAEANGERVGEGGGGGGGGWGVGENSGGGGGGPKLKKKGGQYELLIPGKNPVFWLFL